MKRFLTVLAGFSLLFMMACGAEEPPATPDQDTPAENPEGNNTDAPQDLNDLFGSLNELSQTLDEANGLLENNCVDLDDYEAFVGEYEAGMERVKAGENIEDVFNEEEMRERGKAVEAELQEKNILIPGSPCWKKYVQLSLRLTSIASDYFVDNPETQQLLEQLNSPEMQALLNSDDMQNLLQSLQNLSEQAQ